MGLKRDLIRLTISAKLRPRTSLRSGDPKQEAMPIPGFPALATAVSATQSPTELPIARTVNPRMPGRINKDVRRGGEGRGGEGRGQLICSKKERGRGEEERVANLCLY